MTRQGWSARRFQASQQWSTMVSYERKIRFDSQLLRRNCQTFSTGFNSGHLAGIYASLRSDIMTGTRHLAGFAHAARLSRVMEAALASSRDGRRVSALNRPED